jgi:hypothetical protein
MVPAVVGILYENSTVAQTVPACATTRGAKRMKSQGSFRMARTLLDA